MSSWSPFKYCSISLVYEVIFRHYRAPIHMKKIPKVKLGKRRPFNGHVLLSLAMYTIKSHCVVKLTGKVDQN